MVSGKTLTLPKGGYSVFSYVEAAPVILNNNCHALCADRGTRRIAEHVYDLAHRSCRHQSFTGTKHMSEALIAT